MVAPDVFVVIGAERADRSIYRLWEEPKGPDFVLEITTRSTRREDQVSKRELYRSLGVREYWQFDPTNDYLDPPLQGLELIDGEYRPLAAWCTLRPRRGTGSAGTDSRRRYGGRCREVENW